MKNPIKTLTYNERATWGTCPVCKAQHGEPCDGAAGMFPTTQKVEGAVHYGRLSNAPLHVELRPIR